MMSSPNDTNLDFEDDGPSVRELLAPALSRWKTVLAAAVVAAAAGFGLSFLIAPQYTAVNVFLPPQQQQSATASALASLGALSGIAGAGTKNLSDQYIGLLESATISDRIIAKFNLKSLWEQRYIEPTRKRLAKQVTFTASKKDGLMRIEVMDTDPQRAAAMANQYVIELRDLTTNFAVTEAQGRRIFFEHLLEKTRDRLTNAQSALEASGYSAGALKASPGTAAQGYAELKAELTSAEVKLQVLRNQRADSSPEVQSQVQMVNALASQVAKLEAQDAKHPPQSDYVARYREFKYQETLFDLFARQFETAQADEGREGALIQVLDPATPPELKSFPNRKLLAVAAGMIGLLVTAITLCVHGARSRRRAATALHVQG
jgi:uncharacterized protein involved in exopolysaccharide biosynthesis